MFISDTFLKKLNIPWMNITTHFTRIGYIDVKHWAEQWSQKFSFHPQKQLLLCNTCFRFFFVTSTLHTLLPDALYHCLDGELSLKTPGNGSHAQRLKSQRFGTSSTELSKARPTKAKMQAALSCRGSYRIEAAVERRCTDNPLPNLSVSSLSGSSRTASAWCSRTKAPEFGGAEGNTRREANNMLQCRV